MGSPSPEVEAQFRALREAYAAELPGRIARLDSAWRAYVAGATDKLCALHEQAHSLAGSGATFGFLDLSQLAQALEQEVEAFVDEKSSELDDGARARIESFLAAVRALPKLAGMQVPPASSHVSGFFPRVDSPLIYLFEQNLPQAQYLALQLRQFGYTVRIFLNFAGLRAAVEQTLPAGLVVDVQTPEGSLAGANAVAELQRGREQPVPVIFISDWGEIAARLAAVRAGGRAYFTKPVDIAALVDTLDELTAIQPVEPYHILIVEDEPELAAHHALILQQAGMVTTTVTDPLQALGVLVETRPDLVLTDVYMPGCTGLELAAVIRQQEAFVSMPIVFLSQDRTMDRRMAALGRGGDDFLSKPIHPEHLISSVSARAHRARTLRSLMVRDSLTGLLNHTALKEQLEIEIARAQRQQKPLAFAMLDLDHFKLINDTYGHPAGDRVLKSVARLLQQRLRKTDIIGRYGGEEFAVIFPDTKLDRARRVLDEIREAFAELRLQADQQVVAATFSGGVAAYPQASTAAAVCGAADMALYRAKESGRNRVFAADHPDPRL